MRRAARSCCNWLLSLVFSSLLIPHFASAHPAPKEPPASVPSLSFGHIILRTTTLLPSEDRASIESMLRWKMSALATPGDPEMQQLGHDLVRDAYQDHGYFKVDVNGPAVQMRGTKKRPAADFIFEVHAGDIYRLKEIRWRNPAPFSEPELDGLMRIQPGEIFSRGKISAGLDSLRAAYDSKGYPNFTAGPNTHIDDAARQITLEIEIDTGERVK
jgi:outer membrane protein insertion porin family